jgi:predicted hydrocarbon binding protein
MKADHIITIGLGNLEQKLTEIVNQEKGKGEASVRMKNIKALENFLTDIRDLTGSIVFVSDKNYRLDSQSFATQKGFAAESPSFENMGKIMGRAMSKNMADLEDLIFVLANTGSGRINGEKEDIEKYLATMIGNFVFDDVVITD